MVGGRFLSCHTTYLLTLSYKGRAVQILSTCYVPYHGGNDATSPTLRTIPNRGAFGLGFYRLFEVVFLSYTGVCIVYMYEHPPLGVSSRYAL